MTAISLYEKHKEQFEQLIKRFQETNDKINLSSFNDYKSVFNKHILDSLNIFGFREWENIEESNRELAIADIGTGGGFPGLALAIALPNAKIILIDSIRKKCDAVRNIANDLNLNNVEVINDRAENLHTEYDITVSRAVAEFSKIHEWSANITKDQGEMFFYKTIKEPISGFNDKIEYQIEDDQRVIYKFVK